jgi:copper chaperone CopZ
MCSEHDDECEAPVKAASVQGATFQVNDMTCGHCAGTIRKAIEVTLPGSGVAIDLDKHHVTVSGDAALAAQAIREAGYEPQLLAH